MRYGVICGWKRRCLPELCSSQAPLPHVGSGATGHRCLTRILMHRHSEKEHCCELHLDTGRFVSATFLRRVNQTISSQDAYQAFDARRSEHGRHMFKPKLWLKESSRRIWSTTARRSLHFTSEKPHWLPVLYPKHELERAHYQWILDITERFIAAHGYLHWRPFVSPHTRSVLPPYT